MIYREKKIYSGDMFEAEIYPITIYERNQSRRKKNKISSKEQKNLNGKNATKKLIRLINTNFTNKDLFATYTYDKEHLPNSLEQAKRDIKNHIRSIRRYLKKNNLPELKYIAVIEHKEGKQAIRIHHHMVLSGDIDRDTLEKLWKKGRCNTHRLQSNEFGYEGLARYIAKDPKGAKRWIPSRNLKQPKISINDFKYSKRKVENISKSQGDRELFESLYKGYIFRDYKVEVNDVMGTISIYIKMQKIKK
ncbi:rolling circle replication-associated protein [Clostridium thermobutyricum]|uniref:rolling circle replication-associated protein n=1 Tax=Clostridium thermobutyricum TaxID=29372 RepID=UPI0018AAFD98|nr:hypothetical protein [Clostridium thermobutyricum]